MRGGLNQYPPMAGVPALRERVAAKIEALYGHRYDPATEITVTAGATQAILTAILAVVHPGDEVIVLDPCYDSYEPEHRPRRRDAGARAAARPARFRARLRAHRRRALAAHARDHHQLAAQPERHRAGRARRHGAAGDAAAADRRASSSATRSTSTWCSTASTRAWRAFPSWRRAASSSRASARPTTSPAGRSATRRRRRPLTRRVPQGAPVQRVHGQHADAARPRRVHGRSVAPPGAAGLLPRQARPLPRRPGERRGCALLPCQGTYFQCVDYSAVSDKPRGRLLPLADDRDRRRGDSAVGVLRRRLRPAHRALLLRARRTRRSPWRSSAWRAL